MPSRLPRSAAVPGRPAARPVRPAHSSVPSAWSRPERAAYRQPAAKSTSGWSFPKLDLPRLRFPIRPRQAAVAGVLLLMGISFMTGTFPPSAITQAFAGLTTSEAEKAEEARKVRMDKYAADINRIIAARAGQNIAVSTIDLSDGKALTLGDQGTFTAASTAKLVTAITLLHEVETGKISLNKYISGVRAGDLLERMIVDSDNIAWQALNDYLTHDTLQAYTAQLGWTDYDTDINSLLPSDMAVLAAKLYKGELLDAANTRLLLGLMQDANRQEYIVTNVPVAGFTVYHKAGWLDGLMHDVAIIESGKKSIALAIYTFSDDSEGDSLANQELFAEITRATLSAYQM
jgi:beta-lactamase class A